MAAKWTSGVGDDDCGRASPFQVEPSLEQAAAPAGVEGVEGVERARAEGAETVEVVWVAEVAAAAEVDDEVAHAEVTALRLECPAPPATRHSVEPRG